MLKAAVSFAFALQAYVPHSFINISGHVYRADGTPAVYTLVEAIPNSGGHSGPVPHTYTDRAGGFTVDLPLYGSYTVIALEPKTALGLGIQWEARTTVNLRWGEVASGINLRLHAK